MLQEEIKVSVVCLAYNHSKYIRKCLDGFVMQKTNFKFEVLIHDDASTDGTADIIREYEAKYPDIIKTIYQTENQYSKGVKILLTLLFPKAKGKYVAICEGDDYWCDENKLQEQFDIMECHPKCSICTHKVAVLNEDGSSIGDSIPNVVRSTGIIEQQQFCEIVYASHPFQTSSYFLKSHIIDEVLRLSDTDFSLLNGDVKFLYISMLNGSCYYLNKTMSNWRKCSIGSYTSSIKNWNSEMFLNHYKKEISAEIYYNEYSKNKFQKFSNLKVSRLLVKCVKINPLDRELMKYKRFIKYALYDKSSTIKSKILIIAWWVCPRIANLILKAI